MHDIRLGIRNDRGRREHAREARHLVNAVFSNVSYAFSKMDGRDPGFFASELNIEQT